MKISTLGFELIKSLEGFVSTPYICPAGLITIGFGHVVRAGENYQALTYRQAEELLRQDLLKYEQLLNGANIPALSQNQFDALISLAYNIGAAAFIKSTLLRKLKSGRFMETGDEFTRWIYCKGEVVSGLVRRRRKERSLFLSN